MAEEEDESKKFPRKYLKAIPKQDDVQVDMAEPQNLQGPDLERFQAFRAAKFRNSVISKLIGCHVDQKKGERETHIVLSGAAKVLVGQIIEECKVIQNDERRISPSPPAAFQIQPQHIREAYRRLSERGKIPVFAHTSSTVRPTRSLFSSMPKRHKRWEGPKPPSEPPAPMSATAPAPAPTPPSSSSSSSSSAAAGAAASSSSVGSAASAVSAVAAGTSSSSSSSLSSSSSSSLSSSAIPPQTARGLGARPTIPSAQTPMSSSSSSSSSSTQHLMRIGGMQQHPQQAPTASHSQQQYQSHAQLQQQQQLQMQQQLLRQQQQQQQQLLMQQQQQQQQRRPPF